MPVVAIPADIWAAFILAVSLLVIMLSAAYWVTIILTRLFE